MSSSQVSTKGEWQGQPKCRDQTYLRLKASLWLVLFPVQTLNTGSMEQSGKELRIMIMFMLMEMSSSQVSTRGEWQGQQMQRLVLFTIKSTSMVGSVSLVKTLNTGIMEQSGKDNDDGDDDDCHHHQYCHHLIYICDNEDETNMFAPTCRHWTWGTWNCSVVN